MWRPQKSELGAKAAKAQTSAVKRLLQDLKAIRENDVPTVGVVASPLEKDLFVWHCNIRGPKGSMYEGGVFHFILKFPLSYPYDPPSVTVCTTLKHPNVFGDKICLDMLEPGDEQEKYIGWSSAYSAQSILIQLQSFLFEESPTIKPEDCRVAIEQANNYSCKHCPHRPLRSWPAFPAHEKESFTMVKSELELTKEELLCFHSKRSFVEDCLGFGISFTKNIRTGDIQDISTPLDLIGIRAFMRDGIRKSSINEPFTHWMPVFINEEHGKQAFHLAKKSLSMICAGNTKSFKPEMALTVFPKLMNTMIGQIMKGQIHASIKALEGYCAFHQMFIKFLQEYPELLEQCRKTVQAFLEDAQGRHKDKLPSLGEFLTLLSVCPDTQWKDVAQLVVQESLERQVFWVLKDYPELAKEEADLAIDKERINITFGASIVGHRLIMFHMYFLENVVKPFGGNIDSIARAYESLLGRPSVKMVDDMQNAFRSIKKVKNHNDFFAHLGLPITSDEELKVWLRQCVTNSRLKGYHGVEGPRVPTPEELAQESLKRIVPLETQCEPSAEKDKQKVEGESSAASGALHNVEEKWKELCVSRWGLETLPQETKVEGLEPVQLPYPWKHCYLQNNLQDLVGSLSNNPDFPALYKTLDLSSASLKILELSLFSPQKLKSGFHYLTALLSRLHHLEKLKLTKGPDGGLGMKGCRALVKGLKNNPNSLRTLDLTYAGIYGEDGKILAPGILSSTSLSTLILEGNSLGFEGVKGIASVLWDHPSITYLNMSNCSMDHTAAKELADGLLANKKLRHINLSKNPLDFRGLSAVIYNLAFSPSLESLNLSRVSVSSPSGTDQSDLAEALTKLFRISMSLKSLNLWKTEIARSFYPTTIEALAHNRSLKTLDLGNTGSLAASQLGNFGNALATNKSLASLILEKNNISGSYLETLYTSLFLEKKDEQGDAAKTDASALKERKRMELMDKVKEVEKEFSFRLIELNLADNNLGYSANKVLGKIVVIAESLVTLNLENCKLDSGAGESLSLALETNRSLAHLNLRGNNLGKVGAKALAAGLEHNSSLATLELSGNHIGVSGARALAKMLANNKSITTVNLFGNLIDVDGAIEIATALRTNSTITSLDIGLNRIRDKGALALAEALQDNKSLKELAVKLNFIKDNGSVAIAKAVAASNVTKLSLAGNDFEDETLLLISDTLKAAPQSVEFDLVSRIALLDPERVARSIWITPLPGKVTKEAITKLFYDNHCGVVLNVSIHDHKRKASFSKAKYAFLEFAHQNSVSLALDLSSSSYAFIGGAKVHIYRCGTGEKQRDQPAKRSANLPPTGRQAKAQIHRRAAAPPSSSRGGGRSGRRGRGWSS